MLATAWRRSNQSRVLNERRVQRTAPDRVVGRGQQDRVGSAPVFQGADRPSEIYVFYRVVFLSALARQCGPRTSQGGGCIDVELDRYGRGVARQARTRDGQSLRTPACRGLSCASGKCRQCRCVVPCEVDGTKRCPVVPTVLLRECTTGRGILCANGYESISKILDGTREGSKGRRGSGINASGE